MTKTHILSLVAIIAVIGLAWFAWSTETKAPQSEDEVVTETTPKTLRELLSVDQSQVCTFSQLADEFTTTGMVYVADGQMRTDFEAEVASTTQNGHVIVKSGQVYVWLEDDTKGMTMALDLSTTTESNLRSSPVNLDDENVTYSCEDWSTDSAVFELPGNIEFTDLSALMGASTPAGASLSGNAEQCAACAKLPEPQQDQCLSVLKCE